MGNGEEAKSASTPSIFAPSVARPRSRDGPLASGTMVPAWKWWLAVLVEPSAPPLCQSSPPPADEGNERPFRHPQPTVSGSIYVIKSLLKPGIRAQAFNPGTQEAKVGGSL